MKYIILVLAFTLISCEKKKLSVAPGTAGGYLNHSLSRSCASGSVNIYRKTSQNAGVGSNLVFNQGEQVKIRGNVYGERTGNCPSRVSFECDATVAIGGNRAFVCTSGKVQVGPAAVNLTSNSYGLINSAPTVPKVIPVGPSPTLSTYGSDIREGNILVYNNGTSASAFLKFSNPNYPSLICSVSFSCNN